MQRISLVSDLPKYLRTVLVVVALLLVINGGLLLYVKNIIDEEKILDRELDLLEDEYTMLDKYYRNVLEPGVIKVLATSYNSTISQTDNDPHITANGDYVCENTIALSRDLIGAENDLMNKMGFNPQGIIIFGDTVDVVYVKRVIVKDAMNRRYLNQIDLWTEDYQTARKWGKRTVFIVHGKKEK